MITDEQLLNYSTIGNWQIFEKWQRREMLDSAINNLVKFNYVGGFYEKLLVHFGLATDCRTITEKGCNYHKSIQ